MHEQSYLSPILAGRADELSALQRWIQYAFARAGQTILIAGEAGIGKSRLVSEARRIAQARGFTILQGNCFEPDRTLPFAPFMDVLRHIDLDQLAEAADQWCAQQPDHARNGTAGADQRQCDRA